ncbi:MAG: DNA-binding protein [bacterium]|nr:DNA-binding protein [bacterium]
MNNIVVDANIIFSSLVKAKSNIREYLLRDDINYFSPGYVLHELEKHRAKLSKVSELTEGEIITYYHSILKNITFIGQDLISKANIKKAYDLCKDIDEKDTLYVAITIELNGLLWTGDKKLTNGLERKGFKQIVATSKLSSSL